MYKPTWSKYGTLFTLQCSLVNLRMQHQLLMACVCVQGAKMHDPTADLYCLMCRQSDMQLERICNPSAVEDMQKLLQRMPVTGLCISFEEVWLCQAMLAV